MAIAFTIRNDREVYVIDTDGLNMLLATCPDKDTAAFVKNALEQSRPQPCPEQSPAYVTAHYDLW